ncbi:hypothetical protein PV08_10177 [Exophiala spinifera]|uniref:Uncharacterized protein n=1 Tax=Exophiala spinifera TaxID=91928 RepID=A0A0D2AVW9_9EURO|nr:uncharacterized protein PV08_10177 [Exophiala spinifera]KIW10878.1 hypothetical protein PV08_10177 [Exophiala spinifera]
MEIEEPTSNVEVTPSSPCEHQSSKITTSSQDVEKCSMVASVPSKHQPVTSTLSLEGVNQKIRSVPGSLSWTARALLVWLILQFGADSSVPTSNFMIFPLPKGRNGAGAPPSGTQETAGALGLGLKTTTTIGTAFSFLFPVFSVVFAWLADVTFTRLQIIMWSNIMGCLYLALMLVASIPSVIASGHAAIPFMIGMAGKQIARAMVPVVIVPFILDQCSPTVDYFSTLASGERLLVKRQLTEEKVAYLTNGLVDAGGFLSIATTLFEKRVGFWLAWLVPFSIRVVLLLSLLLLRPRIVRNQPEKKGMSKIISMLRMLIRQTGWRFLVHDDAWETVKPSRLRNGDTTIEQNRGVVNWEDADMDALQRFYHACKIFCILPPYFLVGPMLGNLLSAQGSSMTTNGTPNDILDNITSAAVIIVSYALPIWIFPFLRHHGIKIQPILLITVGCTLIIVAAMIGGFLQLHIYHTSPCGYHATGCTKGTGVSPISIWAQTPIYILQSISIVFTVSSVLGVACHFAPRNMMSVSISAMISVYIIKDAAGLGLAQAVSDPYLVWVWFGPALVMSVLTAMFYWSFRHLDEELSDRVRIG